MPVTDRPTLPSSRFVVEDIRFLLAFLDQPLPDQFAAAPACSTALAVANRRPTSLDERIDALTALCDRLAYRLAHTR